MDFRNFVNGSSQRMNRLYEVNCYGNPSNKFYFGISFFAVGSIIIAFIVIQLTRNLTEFKHDLAANVATLIVGIIIFLLGIHGIIAFCREKRANQRNLNPI